MADDEDLDAALIADMDAARDALRRVIATINATGGVRGNPDSGSVVLAVDGDWIDLADAYMRACQALAVRPWFTEPGDEDDLEDEGFLTPEDETELARMAKGTERSLARIVRELDPPAKER
jgi:hypothetical protein